MNPAERVARDRYGRLTRCYVALEWSTFGPVLQRARTRWITRVADSDGPILVLGDGDGRHAAALAATCGCQHLVLADRSWRMLRCAVDRAKSRRSVPSATTTAVLCDARQLPFRRQSLTALSSHFVLDQWQGEDLVRVVAGCGASVKPGGLWAWADFHRPVQGFGRLLASCLLPPLYAFFGRVAGVEAGELEDPARLLESSGWRRVEGASWLGGFVRSELWTSGSLSGRHPKPSEPSEATG